MGGRSIALAIVALGSGPVVAQSPIAMTSVVETGWTSNATDGVAGGADTFVRHSHDMSLTAKTGNLLLRGSLSISQTRFATFSFEDDDEVGGALEAQLALGSAAVLRLGYAVTQSWTGDDLSIGNLLIPIRSAATEHEYLAEFTLVGDDQQVTVAVAADWTLPDDSVLEGLGLPPLRLSPRVGLVSGQLGWERMLLPDLALLGGMEAWFTLIPEADQLTYLRAPADGGRIMAGLRAVEGIFSMEGKGGVDFVSPKGFSHLIRALPHGAISASATPVMGVTLALNGETGVELADPLDGVAGRTAALELGATWAMLPELTLSATLAAEWEWGLYDESLGRSTRTASLGAGYALSERFGYRALLSWSRHDGPGEGYDKAGIALSLTGNL